MRSKTKNTILQFSKSSLAFAIALTYVLFPFSYSIEFTQNPETGKRQLSVSSTVHVAYADSLAKSACTGANIAGSGADWTGSVDISDGCDGSNNERVSATVTGTGATDYYKATGWDFSAITNNSTLDGIEVTFERHSSTSGSNVMEDASILLIKADGTDGSEDKGTGGTDWNADTDASTTYPASGGSTDKWSDTWTIGDGHAVTDIKDTDFGVKIKGQGATSAGNKTVTGRIDAITITVYYSEPAAALDQEGYRWRANHQGETGTTWLTAEDTPLDGQQVDTGATTASTTRLRILVDETGNELATTTLYQLEYATSTASDACTDGATSWERVQDQASSTSYAWKMSPTAQFANGAASTNNAGLTDPTGNFQAGKAQDTAARLSSGIAHAVNEFTELEFSIEASPLGYVTGQSYCFRVTNADDTTNFTYSAYPKINLGTSSPSLSQLHYRWRADHQGEAGTTWMSSEDTRLDGAVHDGMKISSTTRLRYVVDETAGLSGTSTLFQLEYAENTDGTACSAASYTAVPNTASTEDWQMSASSNITDAEATTDNTGLSNPGSGSFVAGQIHDTTSRFSSSVSLNPADNFTEVEWAIEATSASTNGGSYCFRVTNADDTTNFTYSEYARLTLATSTTNIQELHYRWRADNGGPKNNPPSWDEDFTERRKITFNNAPSSENLHNFPMPIKLTEDANDEWSAANIDYSKTLNHGFDVRFVNASSTDMLPHWIEEWDESGTSTAWVQLPFLEAGTTTQYIWMYYNNTSTTTSGAATSSVYDANFVGVWPFFATSTAARKFEDVTSNANDGIGTSFDSDEAGFGRIDGALDFDGTNDYVDLQDPASLNLTGAMTISAWVYSDFTADGHIVSKRGGSGARAWAFEFQTGLGLQLVISSDCTDGIDSGFTAVPIANEWHHIVGVYEPSVVQEIYVDGSSGVKLTTGVPTSQCSANGLNANIGRRPSQVLYFPGKIDEVRISNIIRSSDWIQQEYRYGAASSTTHSFDAEEILSTSASFLASEDTILEGMGVNVGSTTRIRFMMDETNGIATTTVYQLEYATSTISGYSGCDNLANWVRVADSASSTGYAWKMSPSALISDGGATTDHSDLTNAGSGTFTAGETRDITNRTSPITLSGDDFTELEWSIEGTHGAVGQSYCLRLTNADSTSNITYTVYPRISMATTSFAGNFDQSAFRIYENANNIQPSTAWNAGTLAENTGITSDDTRLYGGSEFRLRMQVAIDTFLLGKHATSSFELQYGEQLPGETCTDISANAWQRVGVKDSRDATFVFYDNLTANVATTTSTLLTGSDVNGFYSEEQNPYTIPQMVAIGDSLEYDWPLLYHSARYSGRTFCFRMTAPGGQAFTTYSKYPTVLTNLVGSGGDDVSTGAPVGGKAKATATTTGGVIGGESRETGGTPPEGAGQQGGGGQGGASEVYLPFWRHFASILTGVVGFFEGYVGWRGIR